MRTLKSFEKDLNKCSKCGLCQSACPIFKLTKNECAVSKGKFAMLYGVTKGDLKLSENINKYLDMCLKCGKCNKFCPSGIDVLQIINTAKYEYNKNKYRLFFSLFSKIINFFKKNKNNNSRIIYFRGCVNNIFPQTDRYIKKIFKDIEIREPNFDCCGLPFLSEGGLEEFINSAKHNCELLKDYDYVVTDCASCESTLLEYPKYIDCELDKEKFINWGDLIAKKGLKFSFKKPVKVTFHKPCHLKDDSFFKKIMRTCENIEYIKMNDYDECCGFAGSFGIKNHKLSKELSIRKAKNIIKTGAQYVVTSCPSCIIGLKQGLHYTKAKNIKVVSLLELLSKGI